MNDKQQHFTRPLDKAAGGVILLVVTALALAAITYSRELTQLQATQTTAAVIAPVE